jgi:hypothetical protein
MRQQPVRRGRSAETHAAGFVETARPMRDAGLQKRNDRRGQRRPLRKIQEISDQNSAGR